MRNQTFNQITQKHQREETKAVAMEAMEAMEALEDERRRDPVQVLVPSLHPGRIPLLLDLPRRSGSFLVVPPGCVCPADYTQQRFLPDHKPLLSQQASHCELLFNRSTSNLQIDRR